MAHPEIVERAVARLGKSIDRLRGLDTAESPSPHAHGSRGPGPRQHVPSHWLTVWAVLRPDDVRADDVFADLGSGKARVVVEAARRYPFRRVIGVELSPELTAVAARNLEAQRERLRCTDVQLLNMNAVDWTPPDDLSIVYLFNPFHGEVFSAVMNRLVELVDRRGSGLRIIYVNAKEHDRVMATGRAVELSPPSRYRLRAAGMPPRWVRRYELRPAPARGTQPSQTPRL